MTVATVLFWLSLAGTVWVSWEALTSSKLKAGITLLPLAWFAAAAVAQYIGL